MSEVEYIKSRLAKTERLLGLTEEALELALAALKLHRVLDGRNPTPVTEEQATANLLEEYGDAVAPDQEGPVGAAVKSRPAPVPELWLDVECRTRCCGLLPQLPC